MSDGFNRSIGIYFILVIATTTIIILYILNRSSRLKSIANMDKNKNNININNELIDKYTNIVLDKINSLINSDVTFNNEFTESLFVDIKENLKKMEIHNNNNKINYQEAQLEINKLQDYNFTIVFVSLVSAVFNIASTIGKFI